MPLPLAARHLDEAIATIQPDLRGRLNGEYADSVKLVVRHFAGRQDAARVVSIGVDRAGIDCRVGDAGDEQLLRLDYLEPVTAVSGLLDALVGLVQAARRGAGDEAITGAEREAQRMSVIRTRLTEVRAVGNIHRGLRRVTFGGGDLASFQPLGPDTFLSVLLPPPGRSVLTVDQHFTWSGYESMPESERPVSAYYTVRRWDPHTCELEMWFVLHPDLGPASAWAAQARPGDPVALWGPRSAYDPPPGTGWHLVVADEAGRRRHP